MGSGLQRVDVPKRDEDGNVVQDQEGNEVREVLLEVEDIHKAILEWNKRHFHQADKTPFAGGAKNTILYDLIGYMRMSQAAKDVVEGTFLEKHGDELKNLLPETQQLIKEMAMPEEIKVLDEKINCEILEDDFISGWGIRVHDRCPLSSIHMRNSVGQYCCLELLVGVTLGSSCGHTWRVGTVNLLIIDQRRINHCSNRCH
jgi:hypothetical protein